jgi:signal transduction histidine kinase/ligand-binding sensor domain-containing protein
MRPACWFVASCMIASVVLPARSLSAGESAWSVRVWQSDGLPDPYINGVFQTDDGLLWVATSDHLARFDGARFEAFPLRPVAPRGIRAVLPASDGLWVVTNRGPAARLRLGAAPFVVNALPEMSADVLAQDVEGAVWVGYHEGVVCRIKDGAVTRFDKASGLAERIPVWLASDDRGRVWYAQGAQVGLVGEGRFRPLVTVPLLNTRLTKARAGGMWIGSGDRLFRYEEGGALVDKGALPDANQGARMSVLFEARDGSLWIGTRYDGLFRRTDSGVETVPSSHSAIRCLMEDREGNVWVGTGGGGLDRVQRRVLEVEGASTGVPAKQLLSVAQDAGGALWAATRNGLLTRRVSDAWETMTVGKPPVGGVTSIAADPTGGLFIATRSRQVHHWSSGHVTTWGAAQGLSVHTVCTILLGGAGDLWIAGETTGAKNALIGDVQRLHEGRLETIALPPNTRHTYAMAADAHGGVWIGAARGTLLHARDRIATVEPATSAVGKQIRALHATADGSLWIGYDEGGGLGWLKDGRFLHVGPEQGLPAVDVAQIVDDGIGSLWLGTDAGLLKLQRSDLDAVLEGRATHVRPMSIRAENASFTVPAGECGWTGAVRTPTGALWMPLGTALLIVHPDRLPVDSAPPPALVTRVSVDGQVRARYGGFLPPAADEAAAADLRDTRALSMRPGDRRLDVDLTAPTFRTPEDVRFRYLLDNYDEQWVDAGTSRVARYTKLPPGRYRFRVSSCTREGACDEGSAAIDIAVAPLFRQTWWFRLGGLALFTAGLVSVVRYGSYRRLRRSLVALEQQAALDRERTRIARDIHDDVGNRLNRITLLSELALRDAAEPARMTTHVRDISSGVRDVITALDEVVWTVSPRNDTLPHLVGRLGQFAVEYLRTAGIHCELELPAHPPEWPVSAEVRHHVFCAVKEALTNSVRHAGPREVKLRVEVGAGSFTVVVEDDGRGFAGQASDPGADGLRNMQQRMAEVGGEALITSAPGAGTSVRLVVPWPRRSSPSSSTL